MASAVLDLLVNLKDEASAGLGGIASSVGGMIGPLALVAAGTAAVTGALAGAVSSAATFEGSMGKLAAVTGMSGDEMKEFSDLALKMGMETAYSAQEAADAMIELAKGGIDPATIKAGGLKAALDLAAAGGLELAASAEILAKQLGVWASDGVTAANVSDLLAQAANASTVDVDELALGLANVGGVAKVAGANFQDVVTTMAMIAPGFSSSADAGTSLKAVFNNLQPTTDKAKQTFYELGLTSIDSQKALEALKAAGVKINSEWTTKEIQTELENLADSFDMSKKDTTLWLDQFTTNKFYDAQGNFVGMQKAADLLADSLDNLTPAQRAMALETMFGSDGMRAAALIAEKAGEGYDNVSAAMSKAGSAAEQAAKMNQGLAKAWDALKGSVETIGIVVGMMLLPLLTTLVTDVLTPAVNAVLAFAQSFADGSTTISVAGEDLGVVFETIQEVVNAVMPAIEDIVTTVLNVITDLWTTHGADIMATVSRVWTVIQSIISSVIGIIGIIIETTLGVIRDYITEHYDEIKAIFAIAWAAIKIVVETALTLIQGILKAVYQLMQGDTKGALETMKSTFSTIWENIKSTVTTLIGQVKDVVQRKMDETKAQIDNILNTIKTLFTMAWNAVVQIVTDKISAARDAAAALVNAMRSAVEAGMGAVRNAIIAPIEAAIATVRGLIEGLWTSFNALKTAASNFRMPSNPAPAPGSVNPANGQPLPGPGIRTNNARAGGGVTINIDARGASASEVEQAVDKALRKAGLRAESRIKLA